MVPRCIWFGRGPDVYAVTLQVPARTLLVPVIDGLGPGALDVVPELIPGPGHSYHGLHTACHTCNSLFPIPENEGRPSYHLLPLLITTRFLPFCCHLHTLDRFNSRFPVPQPPHYSLRTRARTDTWDWRVRAHHAHTPHTPRYWLVYTRTHGTPRTLDATHLHPRPHGGSFLVRDQLADDGCWTQLRGPTPSGCPTGSWITHTILHTLPLPDDRRRTLLTLDCRYCRCCHD